MGITLVKTNYFPELVSSMAVLKVYVELVIFKCWTVIWRLTSIILYYMQKQKMMEVNGKSTWNGFNLGLGSDQVALKSQISLSRNFLIVLVISFNVSVDAVRMFLSCSMIMIFLWLSKAWPCLLKCLQVGILVDNNNEAAFTIDSIVYFKRFVGLITFKCCCWNKLLTAKATCWGTLSCAMIIFSFSKFFVVMDGFSANDLFQASAFLKDYNGKRAKGFFKTFICL